MICVRLHPPLNHVQRSKSSSILLSIFFLSVLLADLHSRDDIHLSCTHHHLHLLRRMMHPYVNNRTMTKKKQNHMEDLRYDMFAYLASPLQLPFFSSLPLRALICGGGVEARTRYAYIQEHHTERLGRIRAR